MQLKAPRRRISPRAIRRYQTIKNFVRKALGSSELKSNSTISDSVYDLRQKIDGIEEQLNTVSKHCQELASHGSRITLQDNEDYDSDTYTDAKVHETSETEALYKRSVNRCKKPVNSKSTPNVFCENEDKIKVTTPNRMVDYNYNCKEKRKSRHYHKLDPIQEGDQTFNSLRNDADLVTSPDIFPKNDEDVGYSEVRRNRRRKKEEYSDNNDYFKNAHHNKEYRSENHKNKSHRNRNLQPELDKDFITEIIKRQYRPVKLFGRKESDFSQFTAPVCRDQEFSAREAIQEGSDLCSCYNRKNKRHIHSKYMCDNDLSDVGSICDTRLYSSSKHKRYTHGRKYADNSYNDSTMYDIIPVKEKSSPKSRRKFEQDHLLIQEKYKEVLPSPRTQRPRLNLQSQYYSEDDEEGIPLEKQLRHVKRLQSRSVIQDDDKSNISSEVFLHNRNLRGIQKAPNSSNQKHYNEECVGTAISLQYPLLSYDQNVNNNNTSLDTQTTDVSEDKTDKTLNEIKDILQTFLQEIKKEATKVENSNGEGITQTDPVQNILETQNQLKNNIFNNNNNISSCGTPDLPPVMKSLPNSCCYPILPVCPMNCMQNGYILPNPSINCTSCSNNNANEQTCESNDVKEKTNTLGDVSSETQKLIKEIHNLISQNPNTFLKKEPQHDNNEAEKINLISKCVGGSCKAFKQDAEVGTHAKSCEAIGFREPTYKRDPMMVTYSDTILEKESEEEMVTETLSESEYSSNTTIVCKKKGSKFIKILKSLGILKRNKTTDVRVEEFSDVSLDARRPNKNPPFPQQIINYNMHEQEYFNPHIHPHHQALEHQYDCSGHSSPPYYDRKCCYSPTYIDNTRTAPGSHHQQQVVRQHYTSAHNIPVSPYPPNYESRYHSTSPPQVPVFLKEIKVKSTGTQSVKKMSLMQKLTNKMQVPVQQATPLSVKQSETRATPKEREGNNLFDWKKIHEKAMQKTSDPIQFTYKTQKHLAEGDDTMRNAMLKKLFYKRNPFSPRNLLVKTLLGKEKSSFGEPKLYKPKMFF